MLFQLSYTGKQQSHPRQGSNLRPLPLSVSIRDFRSFACKYDSRRLELSTQ